MTNILTKDGGLAGGEVASVVARLEGNKLIRTAVRILQFCYFYLLAVAVHLLQTRSDLQAKFVTIWHGDGSRMETAITVEGDPDIKAVRGFKKVLP